MTLRENQKVRIIKYLKENKTITSDEARIKLGVARLSARISEMRKSGIRIASKRIECINRFGETTHYAEYYIPEVLEVTDVLQELC